MKYAVEMGSVAMIFIPSFIKTGLGIQKSMVRDRINLLLFFLNKENRQKKSHRFE
jgi:hypothetical protein